MLLSDLFESSVLPDSVRSFQLGKLFASYLLVLLEEYKDNCTLVLTSIYADTDQPAMVAHFDYIKRPTKPARAKLVALATRMKIDPWHLRMDGDYHAGKAFNATLSYEDRDSSNFFLNVEKFRAGFLSVALPSAVDDTLAWST
jgi:hypothetical protein